MAIAPGIMAGEAWGNPPKRKPPTSAKESRDYTADALEAWNSGGKAAVPKPSAVYQPPKSSLPSWEPTWSPDAAQDAIDYEKGKSWSAADAGTLGITGNPPRSGYGTPGYQEGGGSSGGSGGYSGGGSGGGGGNNYGNPPGGANPAPSGTEQGKKDEAAGRDIEAEVKDLLDLQYGQRERGLEQNLQRILDQITQSNQFWESFREGGTGAIGAGNADLAAIQQGLQADQTGRNEQANALLGGLQEQDLSRQEITGPNADLLRGMGDQGRLIEAAATAGFTQNSQDFLTNIIANSGELGEQRLGDFLKEVTGQAGAEKLELLTGHMENLQETQALVDERAIAGTQLSREITEDYRRSDLEEKWLEKNFGLESRKQDEIERSNKSNEEILFEENQIKREAAATSAAQWEKGFKWEQDQVTAAEESLGVPGLGKSARDVLGNEGLVGAAMAALVNPGLATQNIRDTVQQAVDAALANGTLQASEMNDEVFATLIDWVYNNRPANAGPTQVADERLPEA